MEQFRQSPGDRGDLHGPSHNRTIQSRAHEDDDFIFHFLSGQIRKTFRVSKQRMVPSSRDITTCSTSVGQNCAIHSGFVKENPSQKNVRAIKVMVRTFLPLRRSRSFSEDAALALPLDVNSFTSTCAGEQITNSERELVALLPPP